MVCRAVVHLAGVLLFALWLGCSPGKKVSTDSSPQKLALIEVSEFFATHPSLTEIEERFGPPESRADAGGGRTRFTYTYRMPAILDGALYEPIGFDLYLTNGVLQKWAIISGSFGQSAKTVMYGGLANGVLRARVLDRVGGSGESDTHSQTDSHVGLEVPNAVFQIVRFKQDVQGTVAVVVPAV